MITDAKTLGDLLRQRRQELKISLKDVENATSIRLMFLHAIEDGQFDQLIASTYAQGFVRSYASFLGLDGEQMVIENRSLFLPNAPHEFDFGIGTLEMRGAHQNGTRWMPSSLLLLGSVSVFLFLVLFSMWIGWI